MPAYTQPPMVNYQPPVTDDKFGRAIEAAAQREFSARQSAAVSARQRENTLAEIEAQGKLAEAANARLVREEAIKRNRDYALQLADKGVEGVFDKSGQPLPYDQLAAKEKDQMKSVAGAQLTGARAQIDAARQSKQEAMNRAHSIASDDGTGTPAIRRAALVTALADPAITKVPDDVRNQLVKIASSTDKDPKEAMNDVRDRMTKFWGSKGWSQSARDANFSAFYQSYLGALKGPIAEKRQADLGLAMQSYQNAAAEEKAAAAQGFKYIESAGGVLGQDEVTKHVKYFSGASGGTMTPQDRLTAMTGLEKPAGPLGPPAPTTTAPAASNPTPVSEPESGDAGLAGWLPNPPSMRPGGLTKPQMVPLGYEGTPTLLDAGRQFLIGDKPSPAGTASPITAQQVQANKNRMNMAALQQNLALLKGATPAEQRSMDQFARNAMTSTGKPDTEIEQEIQGADDHIRQAVQTGNGDPNILANAAKVLLSVRRSAQFNSGASTPSSFPASAPVAGQPASPQNLWQTPVGQ